MLRKTELGNPDQSGWLFYVRSARAYSCENVVCPLLFAFSKKPSGKKYRYYIPKADRRYGGGSSATGMIPADQIEEVVVNLVIGALQAPESMQGVWSQVRLSHPEIEEPTVVLAMRRLGDVWKQLFPEEQARLVNLLIERVQLLSDGIDIVWREVGWKDLAGELAPDTIGGEMLEMEEVA